MRLSSLRLRMTAGFAFTFAALILVFGGFILWFARHSAERNADAVLTAAANKLREEARSARSEQDASGRSDEAGEMSEQSIAWLMVDDRGRVAHKTQGAAPFWPRYDPRQWRVRMVPLGRSTAVLAYRWRKTEDTLRAEAAMLIVLCLSLMEAGVLGAWVPVGRTLSPIRALSQQAAAASLESLRVQLNPPSQDAEIVHLVATLNAMLKRLAQAISARERFYAAASHELRTPLQTLQGTLELALMRERSVEGYRVALAEARGQSERLSSLVQALLLLNRVESAGARERTPTDLAERCRRWTREFAPLAAARGLRLAVSSPERAMVAGDPSHLDILLRNLLENAVKYALPDSDVQIGVQTRSGATHLAIANPCEPPPDDEIEKLIEPFYRPDVSRNSETGGNGLGLAICKAVALANSRSLSLRPLPLGIVAEVVFTAEDARDGSESASAQSRGPACSSPPPAATA